MRILVLYGTTEGHTRTVAQFIAQRLRSFGHEVELADAEQLSPDVGSYDAVVVAARVHAGRHHRSVVRFVRNNRAALRYLPSAFVSVSLSAAGLSSGDAKRAAGYVARFVSHTGWQPQQIYQAAGARFYSRHSPLGRWILGLVDRNRLESNKDHVFTDWEALQRFADRFEAALGQHPVMSAADHSAAQQSQ